MEGVPHVNGRIPPPWHSRPANASGLANATASVRLKWRLTSLACTITLSALFLVDKKKASAVILRRPRKTDQHFLKKFANEPPAGHSRLPRPGPGRAEPFLVASSRAECNLNSDHLQTRSRASPAKNCVKDTESTADSEIERRAGVVQGQATNGESPGHRTSGPRCRSTLTASCPRATVQSPLADGSPCPLAGGKLHVARFHVDP